MIINAFGKFLHQHRKATDGLRLGQRFVNYYIKHPWPELFYTTDEDKAADMINEWLVQHHYFDHLPTKLEYPQP